MYATWRYQSTGVIALLVLSSTDAMILNLQETGYFLLLQHFFMMHDASVARYHISAKVNKLNSAGLKKNFKSSLPLGRKKLSNFPCSGQVLVFSFIDLVCR